jgi:hypothetical protein
MKTGDETVDSMFDEITVTPDGTVEVTMQEVKSATHDLICSWKQFKGIDATVAATSSAQLGIEWWRALQFLALADSRLKEAFIGGDRSRASQRLYHRYKLKLIDNQSFGEDA